MRRLSASGKDVKVGDEAENKKGEIDRMDNYITGAAIRALREKNALHSSSLQKNCALAIRLFQNGKPGYHLDKDTTSIPR